MIGIDDRFPFCLVWDYMTTRENPFFPLIRLFQTQWNRCFRAFLIQMDFLNATSMISDYNNHHINSMDVLSPATTSLSNSSHEDEHNSSASSSSSSTSTVLSGDHFEHHILEPLGHTSHTFPSKRPCLTWACKACKKKSVAVDRRKAATLRERRRLRKVSDSTTIISSSYAIMRWRKKNERKNMG